MQRRRIILISALVLAAATGARQTSTTRFDGSSWWNYVKVLADDNMEGRQTGSEGKAEAIRTLCFCHSRGKGPAWLPLFRGTPNSGRSIHGGGYQHGYVPADCAIEDVARAGD
jgi:hypothetical protein